MEEAIENEDSEISAEETRDKHLLVIRLKKDTEKKKDPLKIKSHKLQVLKMFFKS